MNIDDIRQAQEELLEQSQEYFEDWYKRETELRQEFTGEEDE